MKRFSTPALPQRVPTRPLLFLLGLSVATASPALAQREVRHLNALSGTFGASSTGLYYQGTYGRFISDKMRFEVAGTLEQGPRADLHRGAEQPRYRGYELGIGIAPRLMHLGEAFYLRMPVQVRTRYERMPATGPAVTDGFSVGPSLGVTGELYLSDRWAFNGEFRQGWFPLGSPVSTTPRYVGGGLSFYLGQ